MSCRTLILPASQSCKKARQKSAVAKTELRTDQVTDDDYLAIQVGLVCMLLFLVGVTAVTQHPEWFG